MEMNKSLESIHSGISGFNLLIDKSSLKMYEKRLIPFINKFSSKYLNNFNSAFTNLLTNFSSPKKDYLSSSDNEPVN